MWTCVMKNTYPSPNALNTWDYLHNFSGVYLEILQPRGPGGMVAWWFTEALSCWLIISSMVNRYKNSIEILKEKKVNEIICWITYIICWFQQVFSGWLAVILGSDLGPSHLKTSWYLLLPYFLFLLFFFNADSSFYDLLALYLFMLTHFFCTQFKWWFSLLHPVAMFSCCCIPW